MIQNEPSNLEIRPRPWTRKDHLMEAALTIFLMAIYHDLWMEVARNFLRGQWFSVIFDLCFLSIPLAIGPLRWWLRWRESRWETYHFGPEGLTITVGWWAPRRRIVTWAAIDSYTLGEAESDGSGDVLIYARELPTPQVPWWQFQTPRHSFQGNDLESFFNLAQNPPRLILRDLPNPQEAANSLMLWLRTTRPSAMKRDD